MKRSLIALGAALVLLTGAQWLRSAAGDVLTSTQKPAQQVADTDGAAARAAFNDAVGLYRGQHFEDADVGFGTAARKSDGLLAARSAYDRGNCALSEACHGGTQPDTQLLDQAVQHYRACLNHEADGVDASTLFDDARHNLELAKLLQTQSRDKQGDKGQQANPPGKSRSDKDQQLARKDPSDGAAPDKHNHQTPEDKAKCPT